MERGLLQPVAPGLLSLLQLKQRGFNPNNLSDTVVPTIDLTSWYRVDEVTVLDGSTVALVSAAIYATDLSVASITVPDNEIWWVREMSVQLNWNVATATALNVQRLAPVMFYRQNFSAGQRGRLLGDSYAPITSAGLGGMPASGGLLESPSLRNFWAPPGAFFAAHFCGSVTDAVNQPGILVFLRVQRLQL